MWHHNNSLVGILTVHVDNFLRAGTVFFVVVVVFGGFFFLSKMLFRNYVEHFLLEKRKTVYLDIWD